MKKAFSLSITLWITAALIAGSVFFIKINKENLSISSKLKNKLTATIETKSNLALIKYYAATGEFERHHLNNNTLHLLPEQLLTDATPFTLNHSTITLQDTSGLINTFFPGEELYHLVETKKENSYYIVKDSTEDWLDKDSLYRRNGAEEYFYKKNNRGYIPRNGEFLSHYAELTLIRGFEGLNIEKYLAHTPSYGINPYTMNTLMLMVNYGMSEQDAKLLIKTKERDIENFEKVFSKIEKKYFKPFEQTLSYSKTLKIHISTTIKDATYSSTPIIDFNRFIQLYHDSTNF